MHPSGCVTLFVYVLCVCVLCICVCMFVCVCEWVLVLSSCLKQDISIMLPLFFFLIIFVIGPRFKVY